MIFLVHSHLPALVGSKDKFSNEMLLRNSPEETEKCVHSVPANTGVFNKSLATGMFASPYMPMTH